MSEDYYFLVLQQNITLIKKKKKDFQSVYFSGSEMLLELKS